jgi:hypothetical protein
MALKQAIQAQKLMFKNRKQHSKFLDAQLSETTEVRNDH